jgi:hypothetical protein
MPELTPAPIPSPHWFFRRADRPIGPLTHADLAALCAADCLTPIDHVSTDGDNWTPANAVPGLIFKANAPPPDLNYRAPNALGPPMSLHASEMLRQTVPFLRISAFLLLLTVVITFAAACLLLYKGYADQEDAISIQGILSFLFAALYIPPTIYLSRYAMHTSDFVQLREAPSLDHALTAQKSFWKFIAISSLVLTAIYLLIALLIGGSVIMTP